MASQKACLVLLIAVAFILVTTVAQAPDEPCQKGKYPPDPSTIIPTYQVSLDLKPQDRWKKLAGMYAKPMTEMISYIKKFILEFSPKLQTLVTLVDNDLGKVADSLPAPYGDEIKGIANVTGINLGEVVLFNIFYEVFTLCTSLVAQDANGNVYHARNLDFGVFLGWDLKNDTWVISELLRPLVANVEFTKNGVVQYKAVTFVGFVGLITAVKPNTLSYSMNERFGVNGGYIGLFEWIIGINRNQAWVTLLARDIFETPGVDFEKAVKMFSSTPILAPCYYILAGPQPNQGAVVTRDRAQSVDIWRMNETWFLVETNYDHWKKPIFVDDRVTPANKCMNQMGQQSASFSGIFNVLSTRPVLNKLTVYTALMEVKTGKMESYIQYCEDPCWPF